MARTASSRIRGSYCSSRGRALPAPLRSLYLEFAPFIEGRQLETHGPLGTLWAGLGLGAFYTALIWVNLLLGHMLTPLFLLPLTWLQDLVARRQGVERKAR